MARGRNRNGGHSRARRFGFRNLKPICAIFCDDSNTAPSYFLQIKMAYKDKAVVHIKNAKRGGALPCEVVQSAEDWLCEQGPSDGICKVFALIDMESDEASRSAAKSAKVSVADSEINVLLSDPCYEVWTLLHLENCGSGFNGCKEVVSKLATTWKRNFGSNFPKKAQADYSKIIPSRIDAMSRAKQQISSHAQSWTCVYEVIEFLENIE